MPAEKIAIAVSGGVDSLVATCLLKAAGHTVQGFHFTTGFEFNFEENLAKIKALYAKLDVELEVADFSVAFKNKVVNYFVKAYREGRTPNPCLVCNPAIKFGLLLDYAVSHDCDKLATGHYARIEAAGNRRRLLKGLDGTKDQSYFLAMLHQEQLARALFPLGELQKTKVKEMAREFGVQPILKDESQDICFIRGDYTEFLINRMGFTLQKGPVVRQNGTAVGTHNGLFHFTVGQRRGINIPAAEPYYVLALRPKTNTLVVGFADELGTKSFFARNVNWLITPPTEPFRNMVKVRYRSKEIPCTATPLEDNSLLIELDEAQAAISPGQGAVLFEGDEVICGGFITTEE